MSSFPTSIFTWSDLVATTSEIVVADPNNLAAELIALQTKLGITSSSDSSSIDYFLKHASGAYRTHKHDASSDDGAATIGALTGLTLANDIDVGNYEIRMKSLYLDVATGTAPMTIASTTKVTNLNADLLDGYNIGTSGGAIPILSANNTFSGTQYYTNIDVDGTAEVDAITLAGAAINAANGIVTLDANSIVKGKRVSGTFTSRSIDTTYQATGGDTMVYVYGSHSYSSDGANMNVYIKADQSTSPPTTYRVAQGIPRTANIITCCSFLVPKNWYWLASHSGTNSQTVISNIQGD